MTYTLVSCPRKGNSLHTVRETHYIPDGLVESDGSERIRILHFRV
jgi:hypothetical protein